MPIAHDFYYDKNVFITGHTGFKGAWLSLLLTSLGANVTGYALAPDAGDDSLFKLANIDDKMDSHIADINDFSQLNDILHTCQPAIIFHLAAQSLVRESYQDPIGNYATNVMGTVNVLEVSKNLTSLKALVNITTDKCYQNKEWPWPYRENDPLGGHDPYSASKACSEIVTHSYKKSFFEANSIGLASARAGNVIGGGDFSKDRIIPDIIRAIKSKQQVILRSPNAVRPWQHVLDVLHGYLLLGQHLYNDPQAFSDSFNFSPLDNREVTVEDITQAFIAAIGSGGYSINAGRVSLHEATTLKLDASKSRRQLNWTPKFNTQQVISETADWYKDYLAKADINMLCQTALNHYIG